MWAHCWQPSCLLPTNPIHRHLPFLGNLLDAPTPQILAAAGELAGQAGMEVSATAIDGQWSFVAASSEAVLFDVALVVDSEKGLVQVLAPAQLSSAVAVYSRTPI